MTDREKVISGLEHCANWSASMDTCDECPYGGNGVYGCAQLARDALALLKAFPLQNGDKLLIPPDYMIGTSPGQINPSISVNPPRIVPKNDKRGHSK